MEKDDGNIFMTDYYRFTGASDDSVFGIMKNLIFRHNLRFLYWLRCAERMYLGKTVWGGGKAYCAICAHYVLFLFQKIWS